MDNTTNTSFAPFTSRSGWYRLAGRAAALDCRASSFATNAACPPKEVTLSAVDPKNGVAVVRTPKYTSIYRYKPWGTRMAVNDKGQRQRHYHGIFESKCKDVHMISTSQDIPITSVPRDIPITSVSRDVAITSASRDIPIKSESRDIPITSVSRDIPITSVSRDIPITSVSRDVAIRSASRDIPIKCESRDIPITSVSRDIPITSVSRDIPITSVSCDNPMTSISRHIPITSVSRHIPITSVSRDMLMTPVSRDISMTSVSGDTQMTSESAESGDITSVYKSGDPALAPRIDDTMVACKSTDTHSSADSKTLLDSATGPLPGKKSDSDESPDYRETRPLSPSSSSRSSYWISSSSSDFPSTPTSPEVYSHKNIKKWMSNTVACPVTYESLGCPLQFSYRGYPSFGQCPGSSTTSDADSNLEQKKTTIRYGLQARGLRVWYCEDESDNSGCEADDEEESHPLPPSVSYTNKGKGKSSKSRRLDDLIFSFSQQRIYNPPPCPMTKSICRLQVKKSRKRKGLPEDHVIKEGKRTRSSSFCI